MRRYYVALLAALAVCGAAGLSAANQQGEARGAGPTKPSGTLIRLAIPTEKEGEPPAGAPAEGTYPVPAKSLIELECNYDLANQGTVSLSSSNPAVVSMSSAGFRNVLGYAVGPDGKAKMLLTGRGNSIAYLQAHKPGKATVTLRAGRKTYSYDFQVFEEEENKIQFIGK